MNSIIVGSVAIGAIIGLRPVLRRKGQKMREHCEQMMEGCEGRGEGHAGVDPRRAEAATPETDTSVQPQKVRMEAASQAG